MGAGHAHVLHHHGHSPVHRMPPELKVATAFGFVLCVALAPRGAWWAYLAFAGVLGSAVRLSEVPARFVAARLMVIAPVAAFAGALPFVSGGEQAAVLGQSMSSEGLTAAGTILAKAALGASASIVLAATTEAPDILRGLGRLRVPAVLVTVAAFMLRYIELIAGEVGRMRTAMTARGGESRWLWQARPMASAAGATFVRSYERGERIHQAMLSRGFSGSMPPPAEAAADRRDAVRAGIALAASSAILLAAFAT